MAEQFDQVLTDPYLRAIARRAGVPHMWVDDALQEMKVAIWQNTSRRSIKTVARHKAIDFNRKLTRRGKLRYDRAPFDIVQKDWAPARNDLLDLAAAWLLLTPTMQRAISRRALGYKLNLAATHAAWKGRKILRKATGRTDI